MALAAQLDVEARLGRVLTTSETALLPGLLEEAGLLVEGYLGVHYGPGDDIPDAVRVVTSRVVARALTGPQNIPEGVSASTLQSLDYSATSNFGPEGRTSLWLSKQDKMMLRTLSSGFISLAMRSERWR